MKYQVAYIPIGVPTFHLESAQVEFDKSVGLISSLTEDGVYPDKMLLSMDDLCAYLDTINPEMCIRDSLRDSFYGGMDIQVGYCNGRNTTYNGFEYHKGSEINIAVTDFMLVLGHTWEIRDNTCLLYTSSSGGSAWWWPLMPGAGRTGRDGTFSSTEAVWMWALTPWNGP